MPTAASGPAEQTGVDVHAWLCQRFASLEQERQTRWQKLLGFLMGKQVPEPVS